MTKFIPRPKLSKKARKELDAQKRTTWAFSPVTKKVESKKIYNRKKAAHVWKDDSSMSGFCCTGDGARRTLSACALLISGVLSWLCGLMLKRIISMKNLGRPSPKGNNVKLFWKSFWRCSKNTVIAS